VATSPRRIGVPEEVAPRGTFRRSSRAFRVRQRKALEGDVPQVLEGLPLPDAAQVGPRADRLLPLLIREFAEIPAAAHHVLRLGHLEEPPADVVVRPLDRPLDLLERDSVREKLVRVDDDLVLADEAAD
jgi:hypothetical protein